MGMTDAFVALTNQVGRLVDVMTEFRDNADRQASALERIEKLLTPPEEPEQGPYDLSTGQLRIALQAQKLTPEEEQLVDALEPYVAELRTLAGDDPVYRLDRATTPPTITIERALFAELDPRYWPQLLDAYGAFCKNGEVLCYNTPQGDRKIAPKWQN